MGPLAALALAAAGPALAQDVTITNARIIESNGVVIPNGSIVVRGGKIVSVTPGAPTERAGPILDLKGMSAMPGFIDAHKHINTGPMEKQQMQDLIESGFTTVLSGGGPGDGGMALRDHIESGLINGPRVIPSERINLRGTPDEARAAIRAMAAKGFTQTGEIAITPVPGPSPAEIAVLKAAVDEGAKVGVTINVHAVSTPAMVAAIDAGVRHLVHLPNKDWVSFDAADKVAETHTHVLELISFGAPIIDVFAKDDTTRFRTGLPWPDSIAGANRDEKGRATGTEAGYTLVNARTVWDATHGRGLGYGSDQNYPVKAVFEHELKSLAVMFSNEDIARIMGPNTAAYLNMQDQIGTLEPGKIADIVVLDGDPMDNFYNFLKVKLVLKAGKIVVDKR
jgi:imidazolonepropionase-like amidohydrolase